MTSLKGVQKTSESPTRIGVPSVAARPMWSALAVMSPVRYSHAGASRSTLSAVIWFALL